jgi:hypothetical protein
MFFVSVAGKGLSHAVSLLFATIVGMSISVAGKGFMGGELGIGIGRREIERSAGAHG